MVKGLYKMVEKMTSWKIVLLFGLLFLVAGAVNTGKPYGQAQLEEITRGEGILDMKLYDADMVYRVFDAQGEEGRQFYKGLLLSIELVFPIVYRTFIALLISLILSRLFSVGSRFRYLCLLPFVGMLADYLENILIVIMLSNYPQRLVEIAGIAGWITFIKLTSLFVDYAIIIVGIIGLVYFGITGKKAAGKTAGQNI